MALVSISEAIKLSGVSRPTFYRKHIGDKADKENRVSVQVVDGRKLVDTSELLRVFKVLHETNSETVSPSQSVHPEFTGKGTTNSNEPDQSAELESLRQQLQEFREREAWYQQQIAEEKARAIEERLRAEKVEIKLLAHITPPDPEPTSASDPVQEEIAELRESLRELSARRWWQVWKLT